ncbi:MAG: DUF1330 domain-containing protein [Pseudomonadota bacterium]
MSVTDLGKADLSKLVDSLVDKTGGPNEPTEEQLRGLLDIDGDGPFQFVNLLKYKDRAEYPKDHPLAKKELSGEEAYAKYAAVAFDHVTKRGGRLTMANRVVMQVIGTDKSWDTVATMQYQAVGAFLDMVNDADYAKSLVHRDAGLDCTEVIVTRPMITRPVGRFKFLIGKFLQRLSGKVRP